MIKEYIKKHPNNGKQIIYTEAYLEMRRVLMEQISYIEDNTKGTMLSNDTDIHESLLPGLKRSLNGLRERFEEGGMTIDVKCCAQYILDMEREQITDPLKCCRYYNGQDLPDNKDALFAGYEKRWMEWRVSS
jgi:effector-binding domain-containing protein